MVITENTENVNKKIKNYLVLLGVCWIFADLCEHGDDVR